MTPTASTATAELAALVEVVARRQPAGRASGLVNDRPRPFLRVAMRGPCSS